MFIVKDARVTLAVTHQGLWSVVFTEQGLIIVLHVTATRRCGVVVECIFTLRQSSTRLSGVLVTDRDSSFRVSTCSGVLKIERSSSSITDHR